MTSALAGIRIIDLSQSVPGAYATRLLAGFGAEVIKIEPRGGDPIRHVPPFWRDEPHVEGGALHLHLNAGKHSLTLDIDGDEDRETLRRLIATADAVLEDRAPGTLEALGLGYAALSAARPDLVMVAVTPFGQTGPFAAWKASELISYAAGGYAHITGLPDREPIKAYGHVVEYHAGLHTSVALLAAVWRARRAGIGEFVDVSVQDAVAYVVDQVPERWRRQGVELQRAGTTNAGSERSAKVFSELLPCKDGYVHAHSPMGPAHFRGIEKMLDEPRWLTPEFAASMPAGMDVIDGYLRDYLKERTREELFRAGQAVNAPWTPVLRVDEVLTDPQHEARGFFTDVDHPHVGRVRVPGYAYVARDTPWETRPAPLLGQDNARLPELLAAERPSMPAVAAPSTGERPRPLAGIRILDLTAGVVGPVGGEALADLGAEIIHIDQPARVAEQRRLFAHSSSGATFNPHHHDKQHLSLDLQQPDGLEVFKQLVQISDVVWENFRPRVMPKFGIECPVLQEVNPRAIHVSLPAFGSTGPYRDLISMGPGVDACSGLSDLTGYEDGPPLKPGNFYADYMNGLLASHCVLVGLFAREQTGRGQHIEAAMREAETHVIGEALLDYTLNGRVQQRRGNAHAVMAPHNVYPTAGDDQWVAIAVSSDEEWRALVGLLGEPEWARAERFATAAGRLAARAEIDGQIAAWTAGHEHRALAARLQDAGVPAAPVLQPHELPEDPQLTHRRFYREIPGTDARTISGAWRFAGTPVSIATPPPEFGEHNDLVLRGLLGLDDALIRSLEERDIIRYGLD
jgi:crotonobetainyl-CoA:carnitine CoA-transferase CaiB-like acyl-CoA transferase